MIKGLDYSIVLDCIGYCLNGNCKRADEYLRYQISKFIPKDRLFYVLV